MKTNLFRKTLPLFLFSSLLFLNSCEKEDTVITEQPSVKIKLSEVELKALEQDGIIPESDIVVEYKGKIFGENIEGVLIDDHFISYEQLNQKVTSINSAKLFTTKNEIDTPSKGKRTITMGVVTAGPQGIDNKQRNAAQSVIHRYKALNLDKLDFEILVGSENFGNKRPDIVVISSDDFVGPNLDGRALFPSNGNPGGLIGLHTRTQGKNWPQEEIISLLMHEMGHTLGLVHADYKTRRSCIPFGLEDEGDLSDDQVIGIPGTNTSGDYINSIMRACNFYAIGDFTAEDKKSLRTHFKK